MLPRPGAPAHYPNHMTDLTLPPHVVRQLRQEFEAKIWRNVSAQDPLSRKYTALLQRAFGPGLAIAKANDHIRDDVPLRPGFYHLLQKPVDAPMVPTPIHVNGEYAEPGDWMFDAMARGNLRERRVRDRLAEQDREVREAGERELRTANENRKERLKEIVLSATRAQVSMDRTIPWTQSSDGRRER